jgi:hypothetical protein
MTGEKWVTLVTDGGFGRRLGEYEGRTVLMGVKTDETEGEFCVVVYWNDPETNEGVLIATVDNSHGQPVHVDKYREGKRRTERSSARRSVPSTKPSSMPRTTGTGSPISTSPADSLSNFSRRDAMAVPTKPFIAEHEPQP